LKDKLKVHRIPYRTPEWYEFRKSGIGGSEIGQILRLDPYNTAARLYAEKIGMLPPKEFTNEKAFWGHVHEDQIADMWKYWNGTKEGYMKNYENDTIVRKCQKINGFVVNPKYPWLYGSLDRKINKEGGINMLTGEPLETESVLECKSLTYWGASVWDDGIPIYYMAQIHQYMIIMECDYAEIALLKDGHDFWVEYIERSPEVCDRLINISKVFWYNRVVPGREAFQAREIADMNGDIKTAEKWDAEVQRLEPGPDTSEAYREFMSERFLKERTAMQGSFALYDLCKRDEVLKKTIKRIERTRNLLKNILIKHIVENGVEVIDFGKLGKIRFYKKKGSRNFTLTIDIKEKPDETIIDEQYSKIDQNCY